MAQEERQIRIPPQSAPIAVSPSTREAKYPPGRSFSQVSFSVDGTSGETVALIDRIAALYPLHEQTDR